MPQLVHWYSYEHRHTALAFLTRADVHFGRAQSVLGRRNVVLQKVWDRNPGRFRPKGPAQLALPIAVYINKPTDDSCDEPLHTSVIGTIANHSNESLDIVHAFE